MAEDDQPSDDRTRRRRSGVDNMVGRHNDRPTDSSSGQGNASQTSSVTNEYCQQLSSWMYQCYYYNVMSTCSLVMAQTAAFQQFTDASRTSASHNTSTFTNQPGFIYRVPRLWKRVAAESIDFLFLLILKLMVTYFAVDYLELIDLDKFDLNLLESDAVQIAYELTSEIIIIEIIHRLIVCVYETICLHRGHLHRPGGSTPGKAMFGIVVVSCDSVDDFGNGLVRVVPAADIGLFRSLLRSLIKNLSAVFFIPASLTVFFSLHNRAAYDIVCKCIVVEELSASEASRVRPRRN